MKVLATFPPPAIIKIEGHTDSVGAQEKNMALSKARAKSVKKILVKLGLQGSQIEVVPMGASKPIATNTTLKGRQKNRRVEIIVTP